MVAILLAWAWVVEVVQAFCPPGCTCGDLPPVARCVGVGVNMVPILFNPRLRRLNMAHNAISSVGGSLVFLDKLEELDFSYNLITILNKGDFEAQSRVRELRLSHNNMTSIAPGAFQGLKSLRVLDLSHNNLADFPAGILDDVPQLAVLHLQHNRLHVIMPHTFRKQAALEVLDLCDNFFRHVPSAALEDLSSLKTFHLCRNRLTRLDSLAFPTETLTLLSLETNNLDSIHEMTFLRLQQLQELNLDGNILSDIPTEALAPLVTLKTLFLNRNKFNYVGSKAFRGLSDLQTLHVSRNPHLEMVHPRALFGCENIQNLTISNNPLLRTLPVGLLSHLHHIQNLDLRANGLEGLGESEVIWHSLKTLDLRDNPIQCNCSIRWLADLLSSSNSSVKVPDLQCAAPEKVRGLYLSRLVSSEHLCGESAEVVVGVVVVSVCFVLFLTLLLMLCRYLLRQQRAKCSSEWPGPPSVPPWQPPGTYRQETSRTLVTEDYPYHGSSSVVKTPITKV